MNKFPTVGGTVGMFRDAILSISRSNQEDMALGAALAIAGTLAANRFSYNGHPVHTHLYVMNIASPSAGKAAAIDFSYALLGKRGLGKLPTFNLIGMRNYSSDVAIISRLQEQRTRLDIVDEFGQIFKGFSVKGDRRATVSECLKTLYTTKGEFFGHETASQGIKGACYAPAVSIIGTLQPEIIREHVTPETLFDGFLSRFLYFMEDINAKWIGNHLNGGLNHDTLEFIVKACREAYPEAPLLDKAMDGSDIPPAMCDFSRTPLKMSPEILNNLLAADEAHYDKTKKLKIADDFDAAAMMGREMEQAQRLAWILCVSDGERVLQQRHLDTAREILTVSMQKVSSLLKYATSSQAMKPAMKVLDILKRRGGFEERTAVLKYSHLGADAMAKAISTLTQRGEIEEVTKEFTDAQGKKRSKAYLKVISPLESQPKSQTV